MKINLTTAKGVLKALGTAIVAAIPNVDYVPAKDGENYIELIISEIHLYSKQDALISVIKLINGTATMSGTANSNVISGDAQMSVDSATGFHAVAEDGAKTIELNALGCTVDAPFFKCTGDLQSSDGTEGITTTITTAKLTAVGTDGSMEFKNGLLVASIAAT